MRTKVTLILVLLNVALLAVILYARREWQAEQDLARLSKRVLGDEVIGIKSLEITAAGSEGRIRLERKNENAAWELREPINWPANDHAVRRIIQDLEFLEPLRSFPVKDLAKNGQALADYGLNPPRLTLAFSRASSSPGAPDVTTRLYIGDIAKANNSPYVLSPDGATVHVVPRRLVDSLVVGMEALRTDTLFTIPVFEVRSLGLQNAAPAPRVRLRRGDGARWAFEAPIVTRASKADADFVINGLNRLRVQSFLTDAQPADTGLDKPVLRVTLEGNTRRETLLVGNPAPVDPSVKKDPENPSTAYYAKMEDPSEDRTQVFVTAIPDRIFNDLRGAQETLRDKHILDFNPASVASVSLAAPGLPEPLVLRRDDSAPGSAATAAWRIVRPAGAPALPADTKLVTTLLQRLSLLTVTPHGPKTSGFLRDAPSDAEVENYGFNLPQREITLTFAPVSGSSLPPVSVTLQLGVSGSNGGTVQARVASQPFIYAVSPDTLNEFPASPLFYRERTLRALPEGSRVTALTLVDNGPPARPLVALRLADHPSWDEALAAETEDRRAALKTVLAGLATLRAKQFVSETFTDTTLVDGRPAPWKYTLEAALTLGGGGQATTTTLQVAERSGGGTQLAGSKEFGVVFALDQSFVDALWTLTYGARDPGPPPAPAENPAATP